MLAAQRARDRADRIRASAAPSSRGRSNTVDDLAYFYLDLLDELDLKDVTWSASRSAAGSPPRSRSNRPRGCRSLVLANAVGIKVGDRETRDIVDIFAMTERSSTSSPSRSGRIAARDYKAMPDAEVRIVARNREATARYAWSPYMHDPKLKGRLHRIRIPTLFLWGASDRILSEAYGRAYCAADPGRALRDRSSAPAISRISSSRRVRAPRSSPSPARSAISPSFVMKVYHFSEHPYSRRLGRPARLSARRPAQPGARSEARGRPVPSLSRRVPAGRRARPRPDAQRASPDRDLHECSTVDRQPLDHGAADQARAASSFSAIRSVIGPIRCAPPRSSPPST